MRGLYIHIPFCIKKCSYCDFVSYTECEKIFDDYIDALCIEAENYSDEAVDTVFIGGGTPSILPTHCIEKIMCMVRRNFRVSNDAEITIESNPGTLSEEKLRFIKKLGINRLSIGVQSFDDSELKRIGRIHNASTAEKTVFLAKQTGFSDINLDLMFSLPGQTAESFEKTLNKAIKLNPTHISCYSLILEEGTPLFEDCMSGKFTPADEESDRALYKYACERLQKAGYMQYEISNFAYPEKACRHNLKYWNCDEYIGLGVAAHSYYKDERFFNTDSVEKYLKGEYREQIAEKITEEERIKEFMIMGLRKTAGISEGEFYRRFGRKISEMYKEQLEKFFRLGLMEKRGENLCLTFEGINVSNAVLCEFV